MRVTYFASENSKTAYKTELKEEKEMTMKEKKKTRLLRIPILAGILITLLLLCVPVSAATVCKIGKKGYSSLPKAIKAVKNGQTITVTSNITTHDLLRLDRGKISYTINFNNKKYTYKYTSSKKEPAIVLEQPTKVTIKKANISANFSSAMPATGQIFNGGGTLILESGTYTVPGIINAKSMTIKGGTFKPTASMPDAYNGEKYLFINMNGGTLTIAGGTFKMNGKCGIVTDTLNGQGGKKLTIKGGTFTATRSVDREVSMMKIFNTASITGGTFNCTNTGIWINGNVTISGGKFNFKKTKQTGGGPGPGISLGGETNKGKLTIKGGTFTSTAASEDMFPGTCVNTFAGTTTITKGTFKARQVVSNGSSGPNAVSKTIIKGGTFKGEISGNNPNGTVTISGGSSTSSVVCRGGNIVVNKFTIKMTNTEERSACFRAEGGKITIKGGSFTNTNGRGYVEQGGKVEFAVSNYESLFKVKKLTE